MSREEQRASERIDVHFTATITFKTEGKEWQSEVKTKDFSAGGVYMLAETCPGVGEHIRIRLHLKESQAVFETAGTVLRVDQLSEQACGFAVQFDQIPDITKV
ncbi:PilZ domain-containing protein [Acidobacteria bacterium AH-259-D05]|nr:PilZ domain-containing protein [Acidobacteria bacterium AH-259-D05]